MIKWWYDRSIFHQSIRSCRPKRFKRRNIASIIQTTPVSRLPRGVMLSQVCMKRSYTLEWNLFLRKSSHNWRVNNDDGRFTIKKTLMKQFWKRYPCNQKEYGSFNWTNQLHYWKAVKLLQNVSKLVRNHDGYIKVPIKLSHEIRKDNVNCVRISNWSPLYTKEI